MSEAPYVPFYKPYGMSDEEYQREVSIAEEKLAEWENEQLAEEEDERYLEWKQSQMGTYNPLNKF